MSDTKPILTVYIPTYNRAELLRSILHAIAPQAKKLGDKVEFLVSDNASPDHTAEVVAWAQQFGPIRYHRNDTNIGGGNNILQGPQKLARGEFCWVLGDDDLLRENALEVVVAAIEANPDVDYVFVNHSIESGRPEGIIDSAACTDMSNLRCRVRETRRVERWEDIVAFTDHAELFTFMGNHVMRVSAWREHPTHSQPAHEFDTLESTYPHAIAVARHIMGKPAVYVGEPQIILFMAEFRQNEYSPYVPMLTVVRQLQLGEHFARSGMQKAMAHRYIDLHFRDCSYFFWKMMQDKSLPGRDQLHKAQSFQRYAGYSGFWRMWTLYPVNTWLRPLLRPLKRMTDRGKSQPANSVG